MSMEFEKLLETAMNFIKDVGELTENAKESLDALKDMKKVFRDVQENQLEDPIIEDACILVLFKGFIPQLCFVAAVSKTVQEIDPLESQLPSSLQPKARVIRDHLHKIREKLKEIQATMTEMTKMIKESKPRGYNLTEEENFELKMLMRDLKSDLETAVDYQNETEEKLDSLWWDNLQYTVKEGVVTVGTGLTAGAAAGAMIGVVGGYVAGHLTNTKGLVEKGLHYGTTMGALNAVIDATKQVLVINGEYEKHKTVISNLQAELDRLAPEIREKARKVDDKAEAMKDLKV